MKTKLQSEMQLLEGAWETETRDSTAVFEFRLKGKKFLVQAYDKRDGERFKVRKVRWTNGALTFETFVPSSKYRAKHKLRSVGNNKVEQELTLIEHWVRLPKKGAVRSNETNRS